MNLQPFGPTLPASCAAFDRWLDEGSTRALGAESLAHAAACPRCARALSAERELTHALDSFSVVAPPALVSRVMARVAATPQRAPDAMIEPAFAWWVRAAAEPSVALAGVLAALLLWKPAVFSHFFAGLAQATLSLASRGMEQLPHLAPPTWLGASSVGLALTLAALPAVLWASFMLYAWLERGFMPRGVPVRSRRLAGALTDR